MTFAGKIRFFFKSGKITACKKFVSLEKTLNHQNQTENKTIKIDNVVNPLANA